MELLVKIREIYGKTLVYPACERSKLLCSLTGHKTLTEDACFTLEMLGYTLRQVEAYELPTAK